MISGEGLLNFLEHTFDIFYDVIIPKSQDLPAGLLKYCCSRSILCFMRIVVVLAAIQFDAKHAVFARKIEDVALKRMLAAEFYAKLAVA